VELNSSISQPPCAQQKCQLYRHFDSTGKLLYVGISKSAVYRLSQHQHVSPWYHLIEYVKIENFDSREAALAAERKAVAEENPIYNKNLKSAGPVLPLTRAAVTASRVELLKRVTTFNVAYTLEELGQMFHCGRKVFVDLVNRGLIGHLQLSSPRRLPLVTGWHLIEFLEYMDSPECPSDVRTRLSTGAPK
jgi:hypothetical protein